jgi:hypothetical protein
MAGLIVERSRGEGAGPSERLRARSGTDEVSELAEGVSASEKTEPASGGVPPPNDCTSAGCVQVEGGEIDVSPAAGAAFLVGPADPSVHEPRDEAVAGGGCEGIAAQIAEGGLTGTVGLTVGDPAGRLRAAAPWARLRA